MARIARIASLTLLVCAGGCIEYFAEPPDLGPLPGAGPATCARAAHCPRPESNADTAAVVCREGECALECYAGRHDIDGEYESGCEYDCTASVEGIEACDGDDNDCDGVADEELVGAVVAGLSGVCTGARQACNGGAGWGVPALQRITGYEEDETRCDGLDNDCDGTIDEGIAGCHCDARVDSGRPNRCEVGCDGVDDDDDGRSDESCAEVRCGAERAGVAVPPCNGCPDGTVVPAGWVCIPPGVFTMGSPPEEEGRDGDEGQWPVELTRPLLMQATEVTQGEWRALMGNNPAGFQPCDPGEPAAADTCPVEQVNWWEAVEYSNRASLRDGLTPCHEPLSGCVGEPGEGMQCADEVERVPDCEGYRLPTEAEWEYAARAGTVGRWSSGDDEAALAAVAWYSANSGDHTHPVGRLGSNAWGLRDVHGNVWEWVWDGYAAYPAEPSAAPVADPAGPLPGDYRVFRGGSFNNTAQRARSAVRAWRPPDLRGHYLGFRLVRAPRAPAAGP